MAGNANSGGRNAKSPEMHLLQGTFQKVRHAGHEVPKPPPGTPLPSTSLTVVEQQEWDRMVKRLEDSKTLSVVDDAALYQYVALFAETEGIKQDEIRLRKMSETLMKQVRKLEGAELLAAVGEIVKLQQVLSRHRVELRQGHMALRQWLVEFGQTPSARTRVKLPPSGQKSEADKKRERYFGAAGA